MRKTPGSLWSNPSQSGAPCFRNDWEKPVLVLDILLCSNPLWFKLCVLNGEGKDGWTTSVIEEEWVFVDEINGGKEEPCPMQK